MASMVEANGSAPAPKARVLPWVEKYRPEKVDDVSHQEQVVNSLRSGIEAGQMPHLLFYGPPGTGKTTTMLALARSMYGPVLYRSRILELNASDERGIKIVREKIKTFAQSAVGNQKTPGYPCPRFKFIILDEADTMTPDAQGALRRVIEQYSHVTRFCLICNYVTRLIEPLASRCSKFRFKALPASSMVNRLNYIAAQEGVVIGEGTLDTIMHVSNGDMRKAVTYLQSAHQLLGSATGVGLVQPSHIVEMSGNLPPHALHALWKGMRSGQFADMQAAVQDIIAEGYALSNVLSQLHDHVVTSTVEAAPPAEGSASEGSALGFSDLDKALISEKLAAVDQCLVDGASEQLQLMDLCAYIQRRFNAHKSIPSPLATDTKPMTH